ncbi:hypothetical protein AA313_de0204628 [Arthrobotrys entomopaga]|nr:hypothetical protein AA313_de0204628 [Arthrobotrys entomopaga]
MVWRTLIAVLPILGYASRADGSVLDRRQEMSLQRRDIGTDVMCWWELPSSAIVRDQLYINGGRLQRANITDPNGAPSLEGIARMLFTPLFITLSFVTASSGVILSTICRFGMGGAFREVGVVGCADPQHIIANLTPTHPSRSLELTPNAPLNNIPTVSYYLNLGNGFNTSEVPFQTIDTPFAQVTDGFMAANDNGFWLYGGLIRDTNSIQSYPNADSIQVYDVYEQGPTRIWQQGWQNGAILSNNVNRYVAAGAGVNVRELNTTYYFSGARIRGDGTVRDQYRANVTSDQLISADLSDQVRTQWSNFTLSSPARPRINAEMVYLPAGKLGVLVVLGGVLNADWQTPSAAEIISGDDDVAINKSISTGPSFLESVEVYDINDKKWYLQKTTGDLPPTGLAEFCATVATSKDGKTHNIYVYGGYPGQSETLPIPVYDDVYVLSIPAFQWIKVSTGTSTGGRRGHKCVSPLPDQMFIIGGKPAISTQCIDIFRIFNLNTLAFETEYNPSTYEEYKVPPVVASVIGGDESGGATKTASKWAAPTLQQMFASEVPPMKAVTWYPYASSPPTGSPTISLIQTKSETPKFVYPVVAVCVVLILAIIGGCIAFFCLRRKRQRQAEKAAGNEQFQNAEKDKTNYQQQYPNDPSYGYGTHGSISTIAPAYQAIDQYSGNPQIVFELPAEPKGPVELDSGGDISKLGVIDENQANENFSIVPTPATERSDPISAASRNPSTRTRRSIFSEATSPIDSPNGVSPLTPDPEIAGNPGHQSSPAEYSWWRKQSLKGGMMARKFSSFSSLKSLNKTTTSSTDNSAAGPSVAPPVATVTITPPTSTPVPEATNQQLSSNGSSSALAPRAEEVKPSPPSSISSETAMPTPVPPPAPTNTN